MTFRCYVLANAGLLFMIWSTEASVCSENDATCMNSAPPSSLLQKDFRRDGNIRLSAVQPYIQNAPCTGTEMQGRCWHLSDIGHSCDESCANYNRSFSYVVADGNDPVTPHLVGHIPRQKQEPWTALECYVPSEDRYHTANPNAAKHLLDAIGAFTHENCKLACPCSLTLAEAPLRPTEAPFDFTEAPRQPTAAPSVPITAAPLQPTVPPSQGARTDLKCTWKQPSVCVPEFEYRGIPYSGCASLDSEHERPWCQHHYEHEEGPNVEQDWSYCDYTCDNDEPTNPNKDDCKWVPAYSCVKEFDYEGTHYTGCSATGHDTPWCSNTDVYRGSWNNCVYTCDNETESYLLPEREGDTLCHWEMNANCSDVFFYKGKNYSSCTDADYPTPWCSFDRIHRGAWDTCSRICTEASGHQHPPSNGTSAPTNDTGNVTTPAPTADEDPCARHPDSENDQIGQAVSLDESGYKVAAAAHSPINMKRFICRVVDKIACRVVDYSALVAFVPYYTDLESHQTYKKLENELTIICHAGGKWVVPISGNLEQWQQNW